MSTAARAIIIHNHKILVMRRNKQNADYYTLLGGVVKADEAPEQGLIREIKEESGLDIISAKLVFSEAHVAPYNTQLIYVCQVAPFDTIGLQEFSEEAELNRYEMNVHEPVWVSFDIFSHLSFRTPALQSAIQTSLKKGFPAQPIALWFVNLPWHCYTTYMSSKERVDNRVGEYRKKLSITQEELGNAVDVTRQTIISIEKGNYVPSVLLALKISGYFKVPLEKVFTYEKIWIALTVWVDISLGYCWSIDTITKPV